MANKFNPTKLNATTSHLIPCKIDQNKKVSFNFSFLIDSDNFCYTKKEANYLITLIERFSSLSQMKRMEIITSKSPSLRCHRIDWSGVSEDSFGIINEEICDDAYQISVSSNKHGRIHGFFIEDVFYVRWLDPDHILYS